MSDKSKPSLFCIFHGDFYSDDLMAECPSCQDGVPNQPVMISEDGVYINDNDGPIVIWTMQEWVDDPRVVISIASAIRMRLQDGGNEALRFVISAENV